MADIKFQKSAFIAGHAKLRNLPLERVGVHHHCGSLAGRHEIGDGKIRMDDLINDNVCGSRF